MGENSKLPEPNILGLADLFHEHAGAEKGNDRFPSGCTIVLSGPPGAGKTTFAMGLVRSLLEPKEKPASEQISRHTVLQKGPYPSHIIYYISTEVNRPRLKRMFESRGWFAEDDLLFAPNPDPGCTSGLHVINPPMEIERPVKTSEELVNFVVRQISVQPPPSDNQFVFIVIDSITSLFKDCRGTGEARRQVHELVQRLRDLFIKESPKVTSGVESETGRLGYIMLLAEQGIENLNSPGMETYVADFVFNFGLKSLTMGTRLRTLEITKSQGANMMLGVHTWMIVTNQSARRLIAGDTLRKKIYRAVAKAEGCTYGDIAPSKDDPCPDDDDPADEAAPPKDRTSQEPRWGSLVIATRPYFQPARETRDFTLREDEPSGIRGLDQMLRFDPDYWFGDPSSDSFKKRADKHSSIRSGSVTMLVGAAGTGKTTLCFHVVAAHLARHDSARALLVGFDQDFRAPFNSFAAKYPEAAPKNRLSKEDFKRCSVIFRPRSGLAFNLLLQEVREWLNANRNAPKRVAIDGISNLAATHSRQEFSQMLDAIIALFAEHPRPGADDAESKPEQASLFLTYESEQIDPVLNTDTFRLPAHNIIMLSHKVIEDDRRTAVTIIKSSHQTYDTMVRELVLDHDNPYRTHIHSGFDAYSGLLTGRLTRARVVLQLFQENEREKAFNEAVRKHLDRLLPYQIALRDFSRFEITSTLDERGEQVKIPTGDVQIVNMDEWWLAHKVQKLDIAAEDSRSKMALLLTQNEKKDVDSYDPCPEATAWRDFWKLATDNHLTKLAGFVGVDEKSPISPGDFWCFEMEKVWIPSKSGDSSKNIGPYALPSYLDFGMLCVHVNCAHSFATDLQTEFLTWDQVDKVPWQPFRRGREQFPKLLTSYLRPWCIPDGEHWFEEPNPNRADSSACLVDLMKKHQGTPGGESRFPLIHGFAWDSRTPETAATFLYELAWAFGGDQGLFATLGEATMKNQTAVVRALCFIGYLVQHRLMPECPTLTDASQAVFSRHYYSTFMDVNGRSSPYFGTASTEAAKSSHSLKPILISLGFMPPGPDSWQTPQTIEDDERSREEKLKERKDLVRKGEASNPDPHSPNQNDIDELNEWKEFRTRLAGATDWDTALDEGTPSSASGSLRTGYGCCGAWMIGVKSPAGAPGLAQVLLQEITSLSFAKRRARMGAGFPARQDFYRYYGDRPVTGMEYLSWNEILKFLGSKARRRDRIYPKNGLVDPAKMHKSIHQALVRIMHLAGQSHSSRDLLIAEARDLADALFQKAAALGQTK